MSKFKFLAAMAIVAALAGCVPGQGIDAECTTMGVLGGAALGAVTDNNLAESALVGGAAGALAGNAGMCG